MGKHTQNCTLIGKGVYGTIGVDQRSRLADGAHFHTMIVTSTLEASVIEGDKLVIKSGIVRCVVIFAYPASAAAATSKSAATLFAMK